MRELNSGSKYHRYMLTFLAVFTNAQGAVGQKYINLSITRDVNNIPLYIIKQAQDSIAFQLQSQGVSPEHLKDLALMNSSYLGFMSDKEFEANMTDEQKITKDMSGAKKANPFDA